MVTSGSVSEASAETTWGGAIAAMYGTAGWASYLSANFSLTETSTSTASASFKQTTITRTTHAVAGTNNTAGVLPDHDAMVVTFRTGTATKSSHGRWYLPGWTSEDRKSTRLNSSHMSNSYAVFCSNKKTKLKQHPLEPTATVLVLGTDARTAIPIALVG